MAAAHEIQSVTQGIKLATSELVSENGGICATEPSYQDVKAQTQAAFRLD